MEEEIELILELAKEQMLDSIGRLDSVLSKIRAWKASPNMLSSIKIDYYGALTPLSQMSNINTPDSQTISIQPFDKSVMEDIEKAISQADLGLNPMTEGNLIRIPIPPLSEERRKELTKVASQYAENSKIAIRNIRRDIIEDIRKKHKNSDITEDDKHKDEDITQKITDTYVGNIDKILEKKEKEILDIS